MALVKGVCRNYGECSLADDKEIQEVDKLNFVCEECGSPLHECNSGSGSSNKLNGRAKVIGVAAGAFCLLGGLGWGGYALLSGNGEQGENPVPVAIILDRSELEMKVGDKDTVVAQVKPEGAKATFIFKKKGDNIQLTNTGEVSALKAGEAEILVKCNENQEIHALCKVKATEPDSVSEPVPPTPEGGEGKEPIVTSPKTYNLGWATYDGPMSGGKPDGFGGTIVVKTSYTIDLKKASGETLRLNPGDKIVSVKMENGKLRQGEVHFSDGTRRFLSGL